MILIEKGRKLCINPCYIRVYSRSNENKSCPIGYTGERSLKVMPAVIKMESKLMKFPDTNETSMREMYEAAGSVFELPSFGSVMAYLQGGPEPELSDAQPPFCGYAVGKMKRATEEFVLVETDGGRIIKVEPDRVTIIFRTSTRDASSVAASEILECQRRHSSFDEDACLVFFEDGTILSDNELDPLDLSDEA